MLRCLDLNIEPGNEEMARFCRDILSVCVRNTEEAARAAGLVGDEKGGGAGGGQGDADKAASAGDGASGAAGAGARAKGVWSMIEESELAKSIHSADDAARKSIKVTHGILFYWICILIFCDSPTQARARMLTPTWWFEL